MKLYINENECCGCAACREICPHKAIKMVNGELGSKIPQIDASLCISCGQCEKVCPIKGNNKIASTTASNVYAGSTLNSDIALSSSGGIFASLATSVIDDGGICYGATIEYENGSVRVRHIGVGNIDALPKILGSKYVQSDAACVFGKIKAKLSAGRQVLFSGTPCQVAALRLYLGKENINLTCIDLLCHGVPGEELFAAYLNLLGSRGRSIASFNFRDKSYGWNSVGSLSYVGDRSRKQPLYVSESSYYMLFEQSVSLRKSCYSCPFASARRVGDITLGDYWGIQYEHPEYLKQGLDANKGVSCVLVNTEKGAWILDRYRDSMNLFPSELGKASKYNPALLHPGEIPNKREEILSLYNKSGYEGIEKWFVKQKNLRFYIRMIMNRIPQGVKNILRGFLK